MLKVIESRVFWGIVLIAGGILFLLQNLFGIELGRLFWSAAFLLGGLLFLSVFLGNRAMWWVLIPGFTLLGISLILLLGVLSEPLADVVGGSIVLGAIALSFIAVYLVNRDNWWAVIPAGVLLTLAVIAGLDNVLQGFDSGGLLFLGMGLTFALVAILPTQQGKMTWAWIPAGILFFMGLVIGVFTDYGNFMNYLWPAVLILAGGYIIVRTLIGRKE